MSDMARLEQMADKWRTKATALLEQHPTDAADIGTARGLQEAAGELQEFLDE